MGCDKQAIYNKVQHDTNMAAPTQPNLAPPGPTPMVLQNLFPIQGLVATTPAPQPNPNSLGAPSMIEKGVHHLLAMTNEEVNLQTRQNQYGTNIEPDDTSATSTSKTINAPSQ